MKWNTGLIAALVACWAVPVGILVYNLIILLRVGFGNESYLYLSVGFFAMISLVCLVALALTLAGRVPLAWKIQAAAPILAIVPTVLGGGFVEAFIVASTVGAALLLRNRAISVELATLLTDEPHVGA